MVHGWGGGGLNQDEIRGGGGGVNPCTFYLRQLVTIKHDDLLHLV